MPFDADGTVHRCSESFNGTFRGYGRQILPSVDQPAAPETYAPTQVSDSTFVSDLNGAYGERYADESAFFDWSTVPLLGGVFDWLLQSSSTHLLEDGDSGGPLYQDQKLCGINSERYPFEPSCHVCDCVPLPGNDCDCIPGFVECHIYADNWHAPVDSEFAVGFLYPQLVDSKGNWVGTCGGEGPPELQEVDHDQDLIPDACDPCPWVTDWKYKATGVYSDYGPDSDKDGIPDVCDLCPTDPDQYQEVTWTDGTLAPIQPDADHDGVPDACDKCPQSNVRNPPYGDYTPCVAGDGSCDLTVNRCIRIDPEMEAKFTPTTIPGLSSTGFHCSRGGIDRDDDGVPDVCDDCLNLQNADQKDTDNDGVGDACDNCPGLSPFYPGEHDADNNDVPSMYCDNGLGPFCENPYAVCEPGKIETKPDGTLYLGKPHCSLFPDDDNDGLGNACDNCPNAYNPPYGEGVTPTYDPGNGQGLVPGDVNGQPNCNILAELAQNVKYPYVGDACDPNPCNHVAFQAQGFKLWDANVSTGSNEDLWLTLSYDAQTMARSVPPGNVTYPTSVDPATGATTPETQFDYTYHGTPTANVGARYCPCTLKNAWECRQNKICKIDGGLYASGLPWRVIPLWKTVAKSLDTVPKPPLQPALSDWDTTGQAYNLPLEYPPGVKAQTNLHPPGYKPPDDALADYLGAPSYVSWDLTATGATGSLRGFGLEGVYWTAVRAVPQMNGANAASTFTAYSNNYASGWVPVPRTASFRFRANPASPGP